MTKNRISNKQKTMSTILINETKMKISQSKIISIMIYEIEVMTITKEDEKLKITEEKILRAILEPVVIAENEYIE